MSGVHSGKNILYQLVEFPQWNYFAGRVVSFCLDFRKTFDKISHKILIYKVLLYGLDKHTERWVINCLDGQVRAWWSVTESVIGVQLMAVYLRGQYWLNFFFKILIIWMREQSVPSAILRMTQKWEDWMIFQRVLLPSRGISTGWRNELMGTSKILTRKNTKFCAQGWAISYHPVGTSRKRPRNPGRH